MMKYLLSTTVLTRASAFAYTASTDGMVVTESQHGVAEAAKRAMAAIESRGLSLSRVWTTRQVRHLQPRLSR